MRIRRDAVFISSVLFTIAFVCMIPPTWSMAMAGRDNKLLAKIGPGWSDYLRLLGEFGVASLAVIFVVLIVIWMVYVKWLGWKWFVIYILVWVWAFPFLILPNLRYAAASTLTGSVSMASSGSVIARHAEEQVLIFVLMLIALILPIKSFFRKQVAGCSPDETMTFPSIARANRKSSS